jgi:hypothetical protein
MNESSKSKHAAAAAASPSKFSVYSWMALMAVFVFIVATSQQVTVLRDDLKLAVFVYLFIFFL